MANRSRESASAVPALIVGALALWLPSIATGLCMPPAPRPASVPHYLSALIDSFEYGKSGRGRFSADVDAGETMLNLKQASSDYRCALAHVEPYERSENESIRLSAQAARLAFSALIDLDERTVAVLREVVDAGPRNARFGTAQEKMAQIGVESDEAWKLLPIAAISATHALVDVQTRAGLTVAEGDRTQLLRKLDATFGAGIHGGMKVGQHALDAAAATLYGFLNDRGWISRPGSPALH